MRLMVSDYRALVLLLFPLVSLGGMLQLHTVWSISRLMTTLAEPTVLQLFIASMVYPLFLTAFLRLDGANPAFQFSTIMFISAILGLLVYPLVAVPLALVMPGAASPWLGVVVLLVDIVLAIGFLMMLSETDFHKLPGTLIIGSLTCFEFTAVGVVLYGTGTLQKWYAIAADKVMAIAHQWM